MTGPTPSAGRSDGPPPERQADDPPDPGRMDRVALPRFNPWLALLILVLLGFGYIALWGWLLGGGP